VVPTVTTGHHADKGKKLGATASLSKKR